MDNIALHMRISGVAPGNEEVNALRAAATSLAARWGKEKNLSAIISKAADVAETLGSDGKPSPALGTEVQGAIQKKWSSFLYDERPLDVGVCAGMAMVSMLSGSPGNNGWLISDVYATALWSALAYQPVLEAQRRENLRVEVLNAASGWVSATAKKGRERKNVPDPAPVEITIASNEVTDNVNDALAETVEALRRNAALDREELDFLWWAQLGRSRLLKRQLGAIAEPTRIVAAGIEGAKMLRRLPCEVHREIVLRTVDQDPELNLAEILAAVADDRTALASAIDSNIAGHPTVFPLLYALTSGEVGGSGAGIKRRVSEWGERALLEAGFSRMMLQGAVKL